MWRCWYVVLLILVGKWEFLAAVGGRFACDGKEIGEVLAWMGISLEISLFHLLYYVCVCCGCSRLTH